MNRSFHSHRGSRSRSPAIRVRASVVFLLLLATPPASAFDEIAPFFLDLAASQTVRVNGIPSTSGQVVVTDISSSPPGIVTHDLPMGEERTGIGNVPVTFTGAAPGTANIFISGTYKGGSVFTSTSVTVFPPNGTTAQTPQVAFGGDPVNTSTGEYISNEAVDLNLGGPMPLVFARYTASKLESDGIAEGNLGQNRLHNFASRMEHLSATLKHVILPDGRRLRFQKIGTKWKLLVPLHVANTLVESGANFILGDPPTQQMWTYNASGQLTKIEDGKGNSHTLSYTGANLTGVDAGLGRTLTLGYTGGRITTVTGQPGARVVAYGYTGGVLTSVTDQGSHVTLYGESGGLPTSVTRPEGNALFTQTYTGGKVTSQTERGTDTSTLNYGAGTTTFTDPASETLVDNYDANGRLISHLDQAGKAITMTYDAAGRRNSVTDRLGDKTIFTFHALSGLPETIRNAAGGITKMAYKSRKLNGLEFFDLAKITYPDGSAESFAYDAKGNLTQRSDQAGKSWKFTYNARGQVLKAINPLGGVWDYGYDDLTGNLISSKDPDTEATTYQYDARNRLTQIIQPGGATVEITYDLKDRVETVTDERDNTYTYAYDTNDRVTGITDPDNKTTTLGYDLLDRVNQVTNRRGKISSVSFNSRRLTESVTDGNSNTTTIQYDERQRPVGITNPGAQQWTTGFDDEGLPTSIANPVDSPILIKRNPLGQAVEINDPLGNTTLLTRDAMQRVTRAFDPLGRQVVYGYDKRGLLTSVLEQGTGGAKYVHDGLGSLTKATDPAGGSWSYTYTKGGRLATEADPLNKKTTHIYDTRGRLTVSTLPDGGTVTRTYDAASNLATMAYSSGALQFLYGYDELNRLTSTNDIAFEYDAEDQITNVQQNGMGFGATYDDGGRLVTVSYMDGAIIVTYEYDTRDRLIRVTDNQTTAQIDFAYDDADRLTGLTRSNGVDSVITYDGAGRLTRILEGNLPTPLLDLQYALNAAGEIASLDFEAPEFPGVAAGPPALLKFDKASRITTKGYAYDLLGRLTAAPDRTYVWDGASRLVNANGVTLEYNGLGDVTLRTSGADITRYYHHHALDFQPIVFEDPEGGGGNSRAYVWTPEGELLYSFDVGTLAATFYHFDHVGTTLALTNEAGAMTDSYAYGPFGEMLNHTGPSTQPFTYIGAWGVRTEGSLYHMRTRYYDPATARFLSRDTEPPDLARPQTLNPYQYAVNNPLSFIDPEGTDPFRLGCGERSLILKKKKKKRSRHGIRIRGRFGNGARRVASPCPVPAPPNDVFAGLGGPSTSCGGGLDFSGIIIKLPGADRSCGGSFAMESLFPPPIDLCGGPRFSDYDLGSRAMSTDTYKIGATWAPVRDIRFRGNYTRAVRAPNITDLFNPPGSGFLDTTSSPPTESPTPPAASPPTPPAKPEIHPVTGLPRGINPLLKEFVILDSNTPN